MLPAEDVVEELTRTVLETVCGRVAHPHSVRPAAPSSYAVDVHGVWSGTIWLEIEPSLAVQLAAAMLDDHAAAPDDIRDAMCELANVIGGNLKGLLPGPSTLSVPRVGVVDPSCSSARRHLFACDGEPFSVTVCPSQVERSET